MCCNWYRAFIRLSSLPRMSTRRSRGAHDPRVGDGAAEWCRAFDPWIPKRIIPTAPHESLTAIRGIHSIAPVIGSVPLLH